MTHLISRLAVTLGQARQDLWQRWPNLSEESAQQYFASYTSEMHLERLPMSELRRLEAALPRNPLKTSAELPPVDVAVVCHPKDFGSLDLVIGAARSCIQNPITRIRLIVPGPDAPLIQNVETILEGEFISSDAREEIKSLAPPGRYGWALQQVLKLLSVMDSDEIGTLVLDADTVLLKEKTWINTAGNQLLMPSHEYHEPYVHNASLTWGNNAAPRGVSFVTHHQLMQSRILNEMFSNGLESLLAWIRETDSTDGSPFSEYHSYGTWMVNQHPEEITWSRWGNRISFAEARKATLQSLRRRYPHAESVSFHSYLRG